MIYMNKVQLEFTHTRKAKLKYLLFADARIAGTEGGGARRVGRGQPSIQVTDNRIETTG